MKIADGIERRLAPGTIEFRAGAEGELGQLAGYAAVYNERSEDLGGFYEVIAPGAFVNVMDDDVRGVFNHNPSQLLGRLPAGTLSLSSDARGLADVIHLPDTQVARDVVESVKRGDITGQSFAFRVAEDGDDWVVMDDGVLVRTIHVVDRLFDVGPVTYPAYNVTSISTRSLDCVQKLKKCSGKTLTAMQSRHANTFPLDPRNFSNQAV